MKPAEVPWLETQATVVTCTYQFARMNTLTFGLSMDKGPFRISFSYYAHGTTYEDVFTSPTYLEQGAVFPITYNPLAPQQNSKSASAPVTGMPLFGIAVAGSVVLSLIYLTLLRGCN